MVVSEARVGGERPASPCGLRLRSSSYTVTRRRILACQGVVLNQLLAWEGMSGFAFGYAVTGFV